MISVNAKERPSRNAPARTLSPYLDVMRLSARLDRFYQIGAGVYGAAYPGKPNRSCGRGRKPRVPPNKRPEPHIQPRKGIAFPTFGLARLRAAEYREAGRAPCPVGFPMRQVRRARKLEFLLIGGMGRSAAQKGGIHV